MSKTLDDYNWLRSHIHGQFTIITQVFIASVIAAGALLGYVVKVVADSSLASKTLTDGASTTGDFSIIPFLLLTQLVIVLPCAYVIGALRKEIFHWAMYIKVYIEDKTGGWETELHKYRNKFREKETFNYFAITYLGFFIICSLLFWWGLSLTGMCLIYLLVLLLPLVPFLFWFFGYWDIPHKYSGEYEQRWAEIKETEDIAKRNNT